MSDTPRKLTDEELRLLERGEGDELSTVLAPQRLRALEALLGEVAAMPRSVWQHNDGDGTVTTWCGFCRERCSSDYKFQHKVDCLYMRLRAAVEG